MKLFNNKLKLDIYSQIMILRDLGMLMRSGIDASE
jgi:hypothetical protein